MCLAQEAYLHENYEFVLGKPPWMTVDLAAHFSISVATSRAVHDTVRSLVENGKSDPMIGRSDGNGNPYSTLIAWNGSFEPFKWLVDQEHFEIDLEGQFGVAGDCIYHKLAGPDLLGGPRFMLNQLWSHENISKITTIKNYDGMTVLHAAITSLCWCTLANGDIFEPEIPAYGELVRRLLQAGSDIHAQDCDDLSPLDMILFISLLGCYENQTDAESDLSMGIPHDPPEDSRAFVRWWVDEIANAGYDLKQYARKEQSLHPGGIVQKRPTFPDGRIVDFSLHVMFTYGSARDDVEITWEEAYVERKREEEAGDESREMPGGWNEDSVEMNQGQA